MSEEGLAPDGEALARFLAKRITASAKKGGVNEAELANRIGEIEIETQISGASFLKAHIIDPEWALTTSGWLELKEGLLEPIEVEFPEGSGWTWILCAVEGTTDITEPNLTVTFEDRLVAYMRDYWGTKVAPPSTQTRAQFIRDLVAEVGQRGEPKIPFICPSLNVIQPIETEQEVEQKKTGKTANASSEELGQISKQAGVTAATSITVKGKRPNGEQIRQANILLSVASKHAAGQLATEALLFAAIAESSLGEQSGAFEPNEDGFYGVLQGNSKTWPDPHDTEGMATSFLLGGKGFQGGGAKALAKTIKNPVEIAVKVEAPSIWPDNAYAKEGGYSEFLPEAKAIIVGAGGILAGGITGSEEAISDVGQLQRGTTSNPDEDSWECCTRLAQQVDWFFFSDNKRLYYMDGPNFIRQKPALYLDIPLNHVETPSGESQYGVILSPTTYTFDDTTFEYRQTHKVKTRVQRKSKAVKPASPAEIKLLLECAIDAYHAGEVFEFRNSGPCNGRWVITDATRYCLKNTYTQFILEPPQEPLPEPQASGTTVNPETGAELGTGVKSVVEAAKKALEENEKYEYVYGGGREEGAALFGPEPRKMDCSSFTELAFKAAGQPDPSGKEYNPIGTTETLIAGCTKVKKPQPGDLCFFGEPGHTTHVTIYVGNGNAISMGKQGDPEEGPAETTGPAGFLGYYRPKKK